MTTDPSTALSTLTSLVPRLAGLMPPSAHPLLQLLRLHALLLTPPATAGQQAEVATLLTAAAQGARESHPENHPTVGVILATRAKVMAMDVEGDVDGAVGAAGAAAVGRPVVAPQGDDSLGRVMLSPEGRRAKLDQLAACVGALRDASAACDLGFGHGGEVSEDLQSVLVGCERELDMLRR